MYSLTIYDQLLKSKLNHLKLHEAYLPHIGLKYNQARAKTMIIAESHYLPKKYDNKVSVNDWYTNPKAIYDLIDKDKGWFNTRDVIKTYKTSNKLLNGHGIFKNLETAFLEIGSEIKLFDECVYLNYFQRPSEMQGETINIQPKDSEVGIENLMVVNEVLQPNKIIFVSSKAFDNFNNNASKEQKEQFPYIGSVPHPSASAWWNKKSKKYGLKGESVTGKQKFQRIMTPKESWKIQ